MPDFEIQPVNEIAQKIEPTSSSLSGEVEPENLTGRFYSLEAIKYKGIFPKIIQVFTQIPQMVGQAAEGEEGGRKFRVSTPKLRTGKHAKVGLVEIFDNEQAFEFVLRSDVYDAKEYLKHVEDNRAVAEFVPKLYAIVGNWAVLEKLNGLEMSEVEEKMRTDPQFLDRFAQQSFDIIYKTAKKGIQLNDIVFMDGHNIMVDENTGEARFIEQRIAYPYSPLEANELVARQLFTEAYQITHSKNGKEPHKVAFVRKLFERAAQQMDLRDLYIRTIVVPPTHPRYKEAWYIEYSEPISEEKYQHILNSPALRNTWTVNWLGRGCTEAASPELIEAILAGDTKKVDLILLEQKYLFDITDKDDPRSNSIILKDD